MKSPRTSHEFVIDETGLQAALEVTWEGTPEEFVKMVRMCFGLPVDGSPPFWHFLEIMQIIKEEKQA